MDNLFTKLYSKKVLQHFKNPKNVGELKDADGEATVGNPHCGDVMKFYIKVGKRKSGEEYLKEIKFQTLGCGAAIATSSMITTLAKGQDIKDAEKITKKAIAQALGGLPAIKMHCSVLADEGLKKAIENYRSKLVDL